MKKLKIGIIGCGTIGGEIAKACQSRMRSCVDLFGICDIDTKKALVLQKKLKPNVRILSLDDLVRRVDVVVEAASAAIAGEVIKKTIRYKKDVLLMSVGGLLGKSHLLEEADKAGITVYLPSGAVCGIDGLKAASIGRVRSVTLTTRKPPKGLLGAPYLTSHRIDITAIQGETVVFEGSARDAVKGFPQNVNVCAVLSLAGLGAQKTRVRIVTAPDYTKNIHEVEIKGDCGTIVTKTENVPSLVNPKTSQLAIFSAIATLEGITRAIKIGT